MNGNNYNKLIRNIPGLVFVFFVLYYFVSVTGIQNVISWDVLGYYLYLPATFIYEDLAFDKADLYQGLVAQYNLSDTFYQLVEINGHKIGKYGFGMAIFYAPFYFLGDLFASISNDYPRDGFSKPYQFAIHSAGYCYMVMGIYLISKVLKRFYTNYVVVITATCFLFGTSYLASALFSTAMPHNVLFFAYGLLIYLSIKWHESNQTKYVVYLGLVLGALILSRPSEIIAAIIPLMWGVSGIASLKERLKDFKNKKSQLFILLLILVCFGIPQFSYWKILAGKWLVTDYGNPAEGFDFLSPHFIDVLFSFRKGWFLYTPIMAVATIGFVLLRKHKPQLFFPLIIFFALNLYIVCSWSCWWYASSFSCRALVQSSFIMLFPLAEIVNYCLKTKVKKLFYVIMILLIGLNIFQTWQFTVGLVDSTRMTKKSYLMSFGRTVKPEGFQESLLVKRGTTGGLDIMPDSSRIKLVHTIVFDFDDLEEQDGLKKASAFSGAKGDFISEQRIYTPAIRIPYHEITKAPHAWLKIKLKVRPTADPKVEEFVMINVFEHKSKSYNWRFLNFKGYDLTVGEWNDFETVYLTPEIRSDNDEFTFYLWNGGKQFVSIDQLEIEVYESK